jgi:hypothetical protein
VRAGRKRDPVKINKQEEVKEALDNVLKVVCVRADVLDARFCGLTAPPPRRCTTSPFGWTSALSRTKTLSLLVRASLAPSKAFGLNFQLLIA